MSPQQITGTNQQPVNVLPQLPDTTSLSAAQANILASSTAQVQRLNDDLKARYHSLYADYVLNMQSGGVVPPERRVPPNADGFVFYQVGLTPVCDPGPAVGYNGGLAVTGGLVEGQIDIGNFDEGTFWSAGRTDTWPAGKKTPPLPAGPTYPAGVYQKWPAPVGSLNITWPDGTVGVHGGWYEKIG
jgi:hypothetical protein